MFPQLNEWVPVDISNIQNFLFIHLTKSIYTLLVCLSVCLYPINVKTGELIRPKFCVDSQNFKKLSPKTFGSCKISLYKFQVQFFKTCFHEQKLTYYLHIKHYEENYVSYLDFLFFAFCWGRKFPSGILIGELK